MNYDDPDYVTANAQVQGGLTAEGVRWALTAGVASNWHPLTWLSHQLDVTLFGLDPRGHHATSVLWHALNAALAFLALHRLTGAVWRSAFCAALFAWHPLRVESVAWVSERKDVLSGFFFFAVLWLYGGYARRRREGRPWFAAYSATLAAFALGWFAYWLLHRFTRVSGGDVAEMDNLAQALHEALAAHYAGSAVVTVEPPTADAKLDAVALADTNKLELRVFANQSAGHALLVARLDNLGKGASGAAVQNLQLMLSL